MAAAAWGATFGKVVPIAGHAADIALDEGRGLLYIANFTGNRIDVMSLASNTVQRSFNVADQPGGVAVSPDGRYLLVTHYSPFGGTGSQGALTVIDLVTGLRQTFGLGSAAIGVAFGIDGLALVVTSDTFLLFDPVSGATQVLETLTGLAGQKLPVDKATFPPQIIRGSVAASADGLRIYGVGGDTSSVVIFSYNVRTRVLIPLGFSSSPDLGPRVMSVAADGSSFITGWVMTGCELWADDNCVARQKLVQFPKPSGVLNVGSHVIDMASNTVYAQVPPQAATPPPATRTTCLPDGTCITITDPSTPTSTATTTAEPANLVIADADNLTVRERLRIPENLAGRSVLNAAATVMYAISDSGVMVLPVGQLGRLPRLNAAQEDLVFRGNFCDRGIMTQTLQVVNAGGGSPSYAVRVCNAAPTDSCVPVDGISVVAGSGNTVKVQVDPSMLQNLTGTLVERLEIVSPDAINYPADMTGITAGSSVVARARILINNHEPDQRGAFADVPGTVVDVLADPVRDRFYLLRQDRNQVQVYDGTSKGLVTVLRTSNTPTQMAITNDQRYLLIGHENAQLAYVYDLDTFDMQEPILFPPGHYPRSLAAAAGAILAASRVAGPTHTIDRVDWVARTAYTPTTLGIYKNSINQHTVLQAAPSGSVVLAAMPDGNVMLYDSTYDTFSVSRKDYTSLTGTYAASDFGLYVVGNQLLNDSLVSITTLDTSGGTTSGFAFLDGAAVRTTTVTDTGKIGGAIQRASLPDGGGPLATRMIEPALTGALGTELIRTLAPLANRTGIISLTTSGFTVLPWNFDAATVPPRVDSVVNTADPSKGLAPGGLISLLGSQLSSVILSSGQGALPTTLGESCLTVNGNPIPMLSVSPTVINAQLPYTVQGKASLVLRTPGGVSDTLNLSVQTTAPAVFLNGTVGTDTNVPVVMRALNGQLVTPSNPIHLEDKIVIYLAGMGKTVPSVDAGVPAPGDPAALAAVQPTVTLGGTSLFVNYAGLAPGQVGVYQIQAAVPFKGVPLGFGVPLTVTQGGNTATLSVRVVD